MALALQLSSRPYHHGLHSNVKKGSSFRATTGTVQPASLINILSWAYCTINSHQHAANRRCLSSIIHQTQAAIMHGPRCTSGRNCSVRSTFRCNLRTQRSVCTLLDKPVFSIVVICKSTEHTSNLWIQPLGSTSRNSSDMAPQIRVKKRNFGHGDLQDLPRQYDKQEQDRIKDRSPQWVTTIRSRQGPSLDNLEAGRSQPETTQILVAIKRRGVDPKNGLVQRISTQKGPSPNKVHGV